MSATEEEIFNLIVAGGPSMVFQPIVELEVGAIVGYEALARFPHSGPDEWFRGAAKYGLTTELEVSAIMKAIPALTQISKTTYLSVNASVETLIGRALAAKILSRIGPRLVMELTEHDAVVSYTSLRECLVELRGSSTCAGVRLGIDDLGAGYSSLRHVLELDPDVIKLDISLSQGITKDAKRAAMVASLVSYSQATEVVLIAEGVETELDLNALKDLGVIYGQGYYLHRPAPLGQWIKGNHEEST